MGSDAQLERREPATRHGVKRFASPSPTDPKPRVPQQYAAPAASSAQAPRIPASTSLYVRSGLMRAGVFAQKSKLQRSNVLGVPTPPSALRPQHQVSPLSMRAHAIAQPTLICATASLTGHDTGMGWLAKSVLPLPSCPHSFLPQHHGSPGVATAHVLPPPAAMDFAASDATRNGIGELSVVPVPSWPGSLPPQHHTELSDSR